MRRYICYTLMICLCLGAKLASAEDIWQIRGIALVKIMAKRVQLEAHQIINISPADAQFSALDDLGGISFIVQFNPKNILLMSPQGSTELSSNRIKTLLSLPLTKDELISIIRHDNPGSFTSIPDQAREVWTHKRHKGLKVTFQDFQTDQTNVRYPQHITIALKNNSFDLQWVKYEHKP